ncbi:lysophospholipid acyltransferase family protein [Porticoccaceae bacterium]|nr:lysophospholipid acyltransferase family protein [Porticoccaceae bacterium]
MKSAFVLGLLKIISLLPLGGARFLGKAMGRLMVFFSTKSFTITLRNLSFCFSNQLQQTHHKTAKKRMVHLGQTFFETPILWRKSSNWLQTKIVAVEGEAYLREALASDKGTILLMPHQGNWEVLNLWMARQTPVTSLYQPPKMAALGNWIKTSREKTGASLVPTNMRGVGALLKALNNAETAFILPDQQPPRASGAFAPLFSAQALTMTLAHSLLSRSNSQALFCTALREKNGWRLYFFPADQAIYSPDQAVSLGAMNAGIEAIVGMAPEQYQWEYKRFRAQPEGSPSVYGSGV